MKEKRAVLVDGDHHRDDQSRLVLRLVVELLAEVHDVEAVLTERRTDGRGRIRLPGGNLQLDLAHFAFRGRHCASTSRVSWGAA